MILTTIIITLTLFYLALIGELSYGFDKVKSFQLQDKTSKTKFSIVIPFRNEVKNLPLLLESLSHLNYSKNLFEVLLVDDESEDNSVEIINSFISKTALESNQNNIKIIKNIRTSGSPKKDAITTAINKAKYQWIVTTDADCKLPNYWLDAFDEFIQTHNTVCIVGPVKISGKSSFFNRFQILDFLSLQGATIGGFGLNRPFLCNGANLAYKTSIFKSVKGFTGNMSIASGDDIFLLEKLSKPYKNQVQYLKSDKAIVITSPLQNSKDLIEQRVRWASKASHYTNWYSKFSGLVVLTANAVCMLLIPFVALGFITIKTAVLLFVIKFSIDLLLIFKAARFFRQEPVLLSYVFVSLIYPVFCVYIAVRSRIMSYKWKGRTFKT